MIFLGTAFLILQLAIMSLSLRMLRPIALRTNDFDHHSGELLRDPSLARHLPPRFDYAAPDSKRSYLPRSVCLVASYAGLDDLDWQGMQCE